MNVGRFISSKYLFSRNSSQAIHWITGISILGISVGTASLLLVLSVFNGFEEILSGLFNKHNPDIKIVSKEGKRFQLPPDQWIALTHFDFIASMSLTLEENALFQYDKSQDFGIIKGVDSNFLKVVLLDSAIQQGSAQNLNTEKPIALIGIGLSNKLGIDISNPLEELRIFVPSMNENNSNFSKSSLSTLSLSPVGIFSVHQEQDYEYSYTNLSQLQNYLHAKDMVSAVEIKLKTNSLNSKQAVKNIENLLGPKFIIKDRYRQDEAFLKIMNLEKWLFYALFSLTLVIVCFTLIGTIWMIVLEKRMDISILKSIGLENQALRNIFRRLGIQISLIGLVLGFVLTLIFYYLQKKYAIVGVPEEFIIDSYPIKMKWVDFIIVGCTVIAIGILASFLPSKKVNDISPIFREE